MDVKRNLLLVALAVVSYLMLLAWNKDYPVQGDVVNASTSDVQLVDVPAGAGVNDTTDLPQLQTQETPVSVPAQTSASLITINTPFQLVTIDLRGGDIVKVALPKFPTSLKQKDDPFVLLDNQNLVYVAQSGLVGPNGPDASSTGRPLYQSVQQQYSVETGELVVDLTTTAANNIEITKRFTLTSDDYLIRITYLINNKGSTSWKTNLFGQIKRDRSSDPSTTAKKLGGKTYLGAVLTSPDDPYKKVNFDDIDDGEESFSMTGGWIGFSQHYFLGGWVAPQTLENTYTLRRNSNNEYLLGFVTPEIQVEPGQSQALETAFWAGPKDQYRLEKIAPDFGLTIDYGMLWYFAYPIFWLLTQINDLVKNYGLSIILLTVIIRLLLYPLSAKQFSSQASMKRLQPKINQLKERYGDDKQKFMQAQMELWKKEKVNPFSGCLPVLIQMPVFLGIYWVLNESVELRQAPFMLWYQDLSVMDSYFILPILLGGAYFLQQHLTPLMVADPMQAKMMKWMPVVFSVFFFTFPAGLVLYYLANAVLGIVQQWYFTRKLQKIADAT
ncbi:MAG: membrane protein insertase YidC [Pseudomonadota bacterium]